MTGILRSVKANSLLLCRLDSSTFQVDVAAGAVVILDGHPATLGDLLPGDDIIVDGEPAQVVAANR